MRATYAVSFEFEPGTSPDEVLAAAAGWFARGSTPEEVRHDWTPGRRNYPLPDDGHALGVEVFESGEGRLWRGTWRHLAWSPVGRRLVVAHVGRKLPDSTTG